MGSAAFAARLLLAAVFIAAGVGKLLDLPGSRRALLGFGVSESLADFGGVALPVVELATAAALLVEPLARWGAVAALVLLAAFTVGIISALARGETPDCHCFGQVHSAPAGRSQLLRNAVLAAMAAFVIAAGPGSTSDIGIATGGSSVAVVLLGASTLLLLVISVHLWRERRRLREHLTAVHRIADAVPPGLGVGALAPGFSILGADGETITLDALRSRGKPVALIFGGPGCGPCSVLVPELQRWRHALAGKLTLGLVGIDTYLRYEEVAGRNGTSIRETYERNPDLAAEADQLHAVFASYRLKATPSAVLVTPDGTIASATVDGRPAIKALIRLAVNRRGAAGLRVQHAPGIRFGAIRQKVK
jgi:uncharacterized membrane protein YphA (DoxX/SURF4 family)/thiol-disulfide isomerase/thioredoxin